MFRGLIDLFNILLWWCFMYLDSFLLMIVAIFYIVKIKPTPHTPIIHQHYSTVKVVQPLKKVINKAKLHFIVNFVKQY